MHSSPWDVLTHFIAAKTKDKTAVGKGQVAEAVFALCASPDHTLGPSEVLLAFEILESLYPQIERAVRRVLADRLADRDDIPPSLVALLARDSIDIARPVLVRSPVLDDAGLVQIVLERGQEHRMAIAERKHLSIQVTDVLLILGDDTIALLLTANPDAALSGRGMQRLMDRARHCPDLHWPLVRRTEMTASLAARLSLIAGTAVRTHIAEIFGPHMASSIDQQVFAAAEEANSLFARLTSKPEVPPSTVPMNSLFDSFLSAVRGGDADRVDSGMARLTRLPPLTVAQILYTPAGRALAVVCRSSGVSRAVFSEVYARLNGLVPYGTSQRREDLQAALMAYDRISSAEADRILDGWRSDPGGVWE